MTQHVTVSAGARLAFAKDEEQASPSASDATCGIRAKRQPRPAVGECSFHGKLSHKALLKPRFGLITLSLER